MTERPAEKMSSEQRATRVMLGVDFSAHAEHAFDWYVKHVHRPDHFLYLIHGMESPHVSTYTTAYIPQESWKILMANERERCKTLEVKYAKKLEKSKVSGTFIAEGGYKAGELVVKVAEELQPTVIIMGTRGMGSMRRTLVGSVSDYVLHHAHCPVIICRE